MSSLADAVDVQRVMRQRAIAKSMYGNGVEYPFAMHLLQRTEFERTRVCPRCGRALFSGHGPRGHIIDHGKDGLCCDHCDGI